MMMILVMIMMMILVMIMMMCRSASLPDERDVVELLLSRGADVNFTAGHGAGDSPIFVVSRQNFDHAVALLFIDHLDERSINR